MARKRRLRGFVLLVPLLIALSLWARNEILWLVLFLVVYVATTATIWVLCFMSTTCDMITKTDGTPCKNAVRGRLRACRYHKREKRAAWLARLGVKRPAARLGTRVARPVESRAQHAAPEGDGTLRIDKPVADTLTFACTLIGTAGTVTSAAVGVVGLVLELM